MNDHAGAGTDSSGLTDRLRRIAARRALDTAEAALRASGIGLIERVVGPAPPAAWQHYPHQDLIDPATGAQAYYHRHAPGERPETEHGHFHLFMRTDRLRDRPRPLLPPPAADGATTDGTRDAARLCHLVAIGLSATGRPCSVFTTNQWVTGEAWYATADVLWLLDRFRLHTGDGDPLIGDWLTAVVGLLRGPIVSVIRGRDAALSLQGETPPPARLADRTLETLAEQTVTPDDLDPPLSGR